MEEKIKVLQNKVDSCSQKEVIAMTFILYFLKLLFEKHVGWLEKISVQYGELKTSFLLFSLSFCFPFMCACALLGFFLQPN